MVNESIGSFKKHAGNKIAVKTPSSTSFVCSDIIQPKPKYRI